MPVKVFNQTYGRDEEKVFGEDTNRSFGTIDVPSVEEFQDLSAQLDVLHRECDDIRRAQNKFDQRLKKLSANMLDREHAERVVAKLKGAISDTSAFTNALSAALDGHEQRLRSANEQSRLEVETSQNQAHASAVAAESCLFTYRQESACSAQALEIKLGELKGMLEVTSQAQSENRAQAEEIAALRHWQAWSIRMQQGGLWARLTWLLGGNPAP